jgi:hypothetical protein
LQTGRIQSVHPLEQTAEQRPVIGQHRIVPVLEQVRLTTAKSPADHTLPGERGEAASIAQLTGCPCTARAGIPGKRPSRSA